MKMVKVGCAVKYFDRNGVEHDALVTCVHGRSQLINDIENHPAINIVYVTDDVSKHDVYGNQIERETSIVHSSSQSAHGFYWTFAD